MKLNNGLVSLEIASFGAEMKSLKYNNIEYLWQGNPNYWKRSSPVLFPIVGRLLDDECIINDEIYRMTQHGFARDNDFKLIDSGDDFAKYLLKSNDQTKEMFPFDFELIILYTLINNVIEIQWSVLNTGTEVMPFQIGAHPAFNFLDGSTIDVNKVTNQYLLKQTPYIHEIKNDVKIDSINIDNSTFIDDALVYDSIDFVTLRDQEKSVTIDCSGFPYIGLWSKVTNGENAPFICLEPWWGIADFKDHNKDFNKKTGMNFLNPKKEFKTKYRITVK